MKFKLFFTLFFLLQNISTLFLASNNKNNLSLQLDIIENLKKDITIKKYEGLFNEALDNKFFHVAWYLFSKKGVHLTADNTIKLLANPSPHFALKSDRECSVFRGITPLHCAIEPKEGETYLQYGGDINIKDHNGLSALFYNIIQENISFENWLIKNDAQLTTYEKQFLNGAQLTRYEKQLLNNQQV